ncbi:MAG: DUF3854 domain-containing protein [Thermomicrobiales bacterium]
MSPSRGTDAPLLSDTHLERIRASAVADHVAAARGYRTVTTKADLKRLGFSEKQRSVPCLLLPVYDVYGQQANYQIRPDTPRINDRGKPVKYELPAGSAMLLDAHPLIQEQLGNPAVPLWITEGIFKADAAISVGLCCVALLGVWNWRGQNGQGGKTALPDWEVIACNGREVYLAFDSDVMTKREVYAALQRLAAFLEQRGAHLHFVYLPPGPNGTKVGLDDYLAAGHTVADLLSLVATELRSPPADPAEGGSPYVATPQGIVYHRLTKDGSIDQHLSNFTAQIVEEIIVDDGVNERGELVLAGELAGGQPLPAITVPVARFDAMAWPLQQWGVRAIVAAGMGTKDRLREAIQQLSPDVSRRRVYEHSGWRKLPEVGWVFLHAGGAIGPDGPVPFVDVALHGAASRILLPDPPDGTALCDAVHTSLGLLELAPDRVMVPLLAAVYRSVLCEFAPADFTPFLVGPTGVYKSELSAVAMQHVGPGFDRLHLPAQWSATPNFLERIAFDFKDVPLVMDDFAPTGSATDVARLHGVADRVLRGVGNRGGRGRLNRDVLPRPDLPPRGLVIGTGEDVPKGHSLRDRVPIIYVEPGDVDTVRLSAAQQAGREGVLAAATAGYLQWLARHLEDLRGSLPERLAAFRARAHRDGVHARTPDAVAHLALGWSIFLQFAVAVDAVSTDEAEALVTRTWSALGEMATRQAHHHASEEPAQHFLELLGSALAGGFAHVASPDGDAPLRWQSWGWRNATVGGDPYERPERKPQGTRVGWIDGEDLYLDLGSALTAVQKVAQASGSAIGVGPTTLAKRLDQRGFLRTTAREQGELKVRRTLEGRRRHVLHLAAGAITLEEAGQSGQSGLTPDGGARSSRISPNPGRVSRPESKDEAWEPGQQIRPDDADRGGGGRDGRIGWLPDDGVESWPAVAHGPVLAAVDPATEIGEWNG